MSTNSDTMKTSDQEVKTTLTIAIDPKLRGQLDEEAAADGRSMSNYISLERRHQIKQSPKGRNGAKGK